MIVSQSWAMLSVPSLKSPLMVRLISNPERAKPLSTTTSPFASRICPLLVVRVPARLGHFMQKPGKQRDALHCQRLARGEGGERRCFNIEVKQSKHSLAGPAPAVRDVGRKVAKYLVLHRLVLHFKNTRPFKLTDSDRWRVSVHPASQ